MNTASLISTLEFGVVFGLLALSMFASLNTGVLSMASVSFAACGAFLCGRLAATTAMPGWALLIAGSVLGAVVAGVVSLFILHLSSHYIAMVTIAVLLMTRVAVLNLPAVTGGVNGMSIPVELGYPYILATLAICVWTFSRLRRSRYGLAAETVREDTVVAATLGINTRWIQTVSFIISGFIGGAAGVLLASLYAYVDADTFFLNLAFVGLAAVVLGGGFHWLGALVGGVVFTLIPELLRGMVDQADQIINGVILVVIMIFLPRGLIDPARRRPRTVHAGSDREEDHT
ncbi:branched-chain amino acid ABC transporter permease [Acrocarpospora pleiomorpha]|uniref:Branched-chain amino acid ABC transporter permease n=1 Tax=Acrocarpospora pleiomorpha TaxID=90975 RepID=A0A5M3XCC7_9ACTN|nr:branched-chain amino acid ABC transporter permease [Acrocarpospora pleiomorpha]GES19327.1 branched-chain amino acid ABC transporter permease [Acrocarpospora pleiomorpha]